MIIAELTLENTVGRQVAAWWPPSALESIWNRRYGEVPIAEKYCHEDRWHPKSICMTPRLIPIGWLPHFRRWGVWGRGWHKVLPTPAYKKKWWTPVDPHGLYPLGVLGKSRQER